MGVIEDYEVLEKIGCGSFGTIKKIRRKADGKVSSLPILFYPLIFESLEFTKYEIFIFNFTISIRS